MRKVLLMVLLLFPIIGHANYLEKVKMEESVQSKAQHILDTMYGKHNFSVNATVSMGKESWEVSYTERADIKYEEKKGVPAEEYSILPGYSAIKNLSPNEAVQMPFNSRIIKLKPPIIKIELDIVTSKEITKSDVKDVKKIIEEILDLNVERGDMVNFIFEEFPIVVKQKNTVEVGIPTELKTMIAILTIASIFMIVYIVLQIKQININKQAVKAAQATAKATAAKGSAGGGAASSPEKKETDLQVAAPTSADSDDAGYFSFVGPHNASQFVDVVLQKELNPDELSIILSYIDPVFSKEIMEKLEEAKQIEIIQAFSNEKVEEKDTIDELEDDLKNQLECTVGGANKLGDLISVFNDSNKKVFLSTIQANQEIYNKVRTSIILFEDIAKLEDGDVKKLIGALNLEVLAASIANDDSESSKKLTGNLTGAAQAMVDQFLDLKKESLSENDITKAKNQVVQQVKLLSDDGEIEIVSKLMG